MSVDTRAIRDYLAIEPDEAVVLSAIYATDEGSPLLAAASLIVGPPSLAESGWPGWRLKEGFHPPPEEDELKVPGMFSVTLAGGLVGRTTISQDEAYRWLRSALEDQVAQAAGPFPEAGVALSPALSPIRVCTHSETGAGELATWLARPIIGFHFPAAGELPTIRPRSSWDIDRVSIFAPALKLLGMSWSDNPPIPLPAGLLVGRFERRAWLVSQRLDADNDLYEVRLGIERDRVDLADLEIEVEERVGNELVFAEHLRLEDTDLRESLADLYGPDPPPGHRRELTVRLPTLGRGMRRSVRLNHRDGMLLDEWESFNIVERISISMTVNGAEQRPIEIGENRGSQDLVALLGGVERVRSQYATLRQGGTHNRIFDTAAEGRAALRAMLERARGELLVVDPFLRDWDLLEGVGDLPPRVLIGPDVDGPPASFAGRAARWRGSHTPFHDRFFLWNGGGVSVGTSAGTFRDRLFRIARLGRAESEVLRSQFTLWWDDPGFERL